MRVCSIALLVFGICCPTLVAAQDGGSDLSANNQNFSFYGFVRFDVVRDDSEMNDTQTSFFVPSEDPTLTSGPGVTRRRDDATLTMHARNTRLGLNFNGPDVDMFGGSSISGTIEWDFWNGVDSGNSDRMRQAFVRLSGNHHEFLAGHTWDLVSPLRPSINMDTYNWRVGNLGDRRAQVRYSRDMSIGEAGLTTAVALGLQGSTSQTNTDFDGAIEGEERGRPQIQARVASECPLGERTLHFGIWYAQGWEETETPIVNGVTGGRTNSFDMQVYGIDLEVPLTDKFSVQGEYWMGENVVDLQGGVGQGINAATGDEIESSGFWFEVAMALTDGAVVAGYSEDNPHHGDLAAGGITRNSVYWVGYHCRKYDPISMGLELSHHQTRYKGGLRDGDNMRIRWWMAYDF